MKIIFMIIRVPFKANFFCYFYN